MDSMVNKKNGTVKEEGELTDDDDDDGFRKHSRSTYLGRVSRGASRYFSSEQSKNFETRNKFDPKRKDTRRRNEADNRRSSRTVEGSSGPKKHHREHQDSRQTSTTESHTPSKFWANRRFRASSVRPLSPRHTTKSSGPKRTHSPQLSKYRGQDNGTEVQDELEILEREQRRIREQLKSLEEEEQNEGHTENDCVLETLDARSEAEDLITAFSEPSNSTDLNFISEAEKSEDEDIGLQELRRLVLATSERHVRLMATEPQILQPGISIGDVVVIPDVEPNLPEPEVVMVDEDEEYGKSRNISRTSTPSAEATYKPAATKKKNVKSGKVKKKGQSSTKKKADVSDNGHAEVKSKVTVISPRKSKDKKKRKGESKEVDKWARQREQLRILVMDNPAEALEKLLKFASEWNGTEKPIQTGTIKDFKRQKQIPVLSDKRAVQSFSQKSVEKNKIGQEKLADKMKVGQEKLADKMKVGQEKLADKMKVGQEKLADKMKVGHEKPKEVKEQDKKPGQLHDNYEEVEMDIDSNAGDEVILAENRSDFGVLSFGEDLNQPMLSMPSLATVSYPQNSMPPAIMTSQLFHMPASLPFEAALQPPIPPPIPPQPPPPPPPPPSYEQNLSWKSIQEEGIDAEIMENRFNLSKDQSRIIVYPEERLRVYQEGTGHHRDLISVPVLDIYSEVELTGSVSEAESRVFEDIGWSLHNGGSSLDDDIVRRLRLIRQNQENNVTAEPQDVSVQGVLNMMPDISARRHTSDNLDRTIPQHLMPLTENSSNCEDQRITDARTIHYPFTSIRRTTQQLSETDGFHNRHSDAHSPSLSDERNISGRAELYSSTDFSSEIVEHIEDVHRQRSPYRTNQKLLRRVDGDRSPSPPRRMIAREHLRYYSRGDSGSPHSPAYLRRPPTYWDQSYSPPQRSAAASREALRDHPNERSHYLPRKGQQDHHLPWPPSPQTQALQRKRRSSSAERTDIYQPEVPPTKKIRTSSPPLYIPTSIRRTRALPGPQVPKHDHHQSSDSEEEDPAALRNKLLAAVIEKRKTTAEVPSNNTTPSAMSPRQDSTHSESSETFIVAYIREDLACEHQNTKLQPNVTVQRVADSEEDEEDVKPPPVISRVARQLIKPQSLGELCKQKLNVAEVHENQHGQIGLHDQGNHMQHPVPICLDRNTQREHIFEDDDNDLSKSDLETLRAYVIKAQTRAPERRQLSMVAEDTNEVRVEPFAENKQCATNSAAITSDTFWSGQAEPSVSVSSSNNGSSIVNPQRNFLLNTALTLCIPTATESIITSNYDGHQVEDVVLINSCTVTSTNKSESSKGSCQPSLDVHGVKDTNPTPAFSQLDTPFTSLEPTALSSKSVEQPIENFSTNPALIVPEVVPLTIKNKPKTVPKYYPASSIDQRLDQSSQCATEAGLLKTKSQASLRTSSGVAIYQQTHLGPGDEDESVSRNISEAPRPLINAAAKRFDVSQSSSVKTSGPATQLPSNVLRSANSDMSFSTSSFSDRPSLSSHSIQSYASAGSRKYANIHILPVHPQVIVPMNSSSGSDGEGDDQDNVRQVTVLRGNDTDMILKAEKLLAQVHGNKRAATQFLTEQEKLLSTQELSIQKDQKTVKLLVNRAVKFLEAQQQEEEKRELFRTELLALSRKMKTSEKLVMLLKAEKDETERQVQLVTERLLLKKRLYARKAKSIVTLGTKLLGPKYVQTIIKPHAVRSSQEEKQSLSRAQCIAQEKLKLKEKEKQIAEKLRKLKKAKAEKDIGRPPTVKAVSGILESTGPKWKSQDVIRIDKDAKPDIAVKHRRKSLLEMNPSTTPNIPLTPRRPNSVSSLEKENMVSETPSDKPAEKEVDSDLSSAFRMPGGTQLANFCKIQREKTLNYLKHPSSSYAAGVCTYPSLTGLQVSSSGQKIRLHRTERKGQREDYMPLPKTSLVYSSPLLMFRSYRFNSYFRTKENLCLQSSTYSHKINPNIILCPYDLQGTCNDDSCQQLHPKDYKFNEHELLEDIVSYCPRLAGASVGSSPKEAKKLIGTFVDNILSKHKGKMSIEDLCLWLLSQVNEAAGKRHPHTISLDQQVWGPEPKEETGISLDLNQKLSGHQLEAINVDKKTADKDSVVNDEDLRYFGADSTELLSLEASIMEDQSNTQLWLKLASKKLNDPNKSQKVCLDQALNVLARGLEVNRNEPDLWHMYLALYKRHPEVKDFPEFCQTALDYAPSYALWFLYLDSLKTFSEKEEVSTQALIFLCNVAKEKRATSDSDVKRHIRAQQANIIRGGITKIVQDPKSVSVVNITSEALSDKVVVKDETLKVTETGGDIEASCGREVAMDSIFVKDQENSDGRHVSGVIDGKAGGSGGVPSSCDWKKLSHQALEMVVFKTCLSLQTGRIKTAIHFLQMVLGLKKGVSVTMNVAEILTTADLLVLWLTYIHILEWHRLPQHLYSMADENPGRILAKENITLPWSSKSSLHIGVDSLVKLHDRAAKTWECGERDRGSSCFFVKVIQSQVSLLISQNRHTEAVAKCRSVLSDWKFEDIWLTTAELYASFHDNEAVKQVFNEALSAHRYNSKLQYYHCMFLYQQGEAELALRSLEQFAASHFDVIPCEPVLSGFSQLYSQLLKEQEAFSLNAAQVKEDVPDNLHKDIHMWLCYSLLLELQGRPADTVEMFERSLTHAHLTDDLILVWQSYISYLARSKTPPKEVRDMIVRSIVSVPTKFPVPFTQLTSAMQVDYYHSNRIVNAWLTVLSPEDSLDFVEMCLGFMPDNIQLLLRAIDLSRDLKETRRAYSWCKFVAAQKDRPANLEFWKLAAALVQVEGTPREVENMMIGCVETMPLAVSGWKDFLLFEVTRENQVAVEKLLTYCQRLKLNIEGFVATLSV